MVDNDIGVDL